MVEKPFPWKWATAAAVLVVVTAGIVWALWPKDDLPLVVLANWETHTLQEARAALEAQKLVVKDENQNGLEPDPQQAQFYQQLVQSQTPTATADPPTQIKTGETVMLLWNWDVKKVDVPPLEGKNLLAAHELLTNAGLAVGPTEGPGPRPTNL